MIKLPELTQIEERYASEIGIQGKKIHKFNTFRVANYILDNNIEGDFAEAGVGGGGHIAFISHVLNFRKIEDRKIHLYDSFCGHPKGDGTDNEEVVQKYGVNDDIANPVNAGRPPSEKMSVDYVNINMNNWKVRKDLLVFHKGYFQNTLPDEAENKTLPEKLAFLRIDVNLRISTEFVMKYLYPRVVKGGIIVCDDWSSEACRDEIFKHLNFKPELIEVDHDRLTIFFEKEK